MNAQATLYLLPTPLGENNRSFLLPEDMALIKPLRDFVVESEKIARRHLKLLQLNTPIQDVSLSLLNEHSDANRLPELLQPLQEGRSLALMSDAGCPAVADPGANLVALAHQYGFNVVPMIGPSSILLALMASGANGQCFAFKGYLPANKTERQGCLKELQRRVSTHHESQIFIETPYRNMAMLEDIIQTLQADTMLCVAANLTMDNQIIISKSIAQWRLMGDLPNLKKIPCIFVIF